MRLARALAAILLVAAPVPGCSKPDGEAAAGTIVPAETASGQPAAPVPAPGAEQAGEGDEAVTGLSTQSVEVYFPAAEEDGLVAEAHEIFHTATPGDRAKQIIADLISGPATDLALHALPPGTQLRQIYVLPDGVAYLDFSEDLRRAIGGGSSEEILAVYSIVNSVVLNVAEIKRVGILIGGEPVDTLNGHLDLRRPLLPDIELIVGRVA